MITEPVTLTFLLPASGLLNANDRLSPHAHAAIVSGLRLRAAVAWQQQARAGRRSMQRARCICLLTFHDKRRRDPTNWAPTAKALVDGAVEGHRSLPRARWRGLLPDDDATHLIGPDMRISPPDPTLRRGHAVVSLRFNEDPMTIPPTRSRDPIEVMAGDWLAIRCHACQLLVGIAVDEQEADHKTAAHEVGVEHRANMTGWPHGPSHAVVTTQLPTQRTMGDTTKAAQRQCVNTVDPLGLATSTNCKEFGSD